MKTVILSISALLLSPLAHSHKPQILSVYQCPAELIDPKPDHVACGLLKQPLPSNKNNKFKIATSMGITMQQCANSCYYYEMRPCHSFTYEDETQNCTTYRRNDKVLDMEPSPDGSTRFWNRNCYTSHLSFVNYQLRFLNGRDSNGQYLGVSLDGATNPMIDVTSPEGPTNYFSLSCDGVLTSDATGGLSAYSAYDTNNHAAYDSTIYFPTVQELSGDTPYTPIKCALVGSNLECSSNAGSSFYECTSSDNTETDVALAADSGPPKNAASCQSTEINLG